MLSESDIVDIQELIVDKVFTSPWLVLEDASDTAYACIDDRILIPLFIKASRIYPRECYAVPLMDLYASTKEPMLLSWSMQNRHISDRLDSIDVLIDYFTQTNEDMNGMLIQATLEDMEAIRNGLSGWFYEYTEAFISKYIRENELRVSQTFTKDEVAPFTFKVRRKVKYKAGVFYAVQHIQSAKYDYLVLSSKGNVITRESREFRETPVSRLFPPIIQPVIVQKAT